MERSGFGDGGLCYCFSFFLCVCFVTLLWFVGVFGLGLLACFLFLRWRCRPHIKGELPEPCAPCIHRGVSLRPVPTQDPLASSRAAWGQQQEAPSSSRVLQLPQSPCCSWCGQPCPCVTSAQGSSYRCWGGLVSVLCPSWSEVGLRSASTAALLPVCASARTPGPAPPRCLCEGPRSEGKYFPRRTELFG